MDLSHLKLRGKYLLIYQNFIRVFNNLLTHKIITGMIEKVLALASGEC